MPPIRRCNSRNWNASSPRTATGHQADGMRPENNEDETREALQQRLIALEQKRRDISAQIAAYDVQLQTQEKYREQEELCMQDLDRLLNR